ncbi:hypothetical protein C8R48DRAFT_680416 [Suillus tomentosus]|nr:hypothetical protein C8R48DRAFT_680412 [Suillus tomentosus]KAG1837024.1 hypothetical protein C8R48DRAFT_680416 [Suillus tomentosus]
MPTSAYERTSRPRRFKIGMVEDQEVGVWNSRSTVPSFWRSLSAPVIDAERAWLGKKCQYQIFQLFAEWFTSAFDPSDHADASIHSIKPKVDVNAPEDPSMREADPVECVGASVVSHMPKTSTRPSRPPDRTKTTFLPMLQFINAVLCSNPTPAQRFGALTMIGIMSRATDEAGMSTISHLNNHSCAVALALEGCELPVRAQAALAIMELVVARDSDLLKLSDETDLDILNQGMEAMVDQFQNELVPVAS